MSTGMESTNPFATEVLHRLPLAEAFYTVWGYLASDDVLSELFDRHRGRCYKDELTFPELVPILAAALTRYDGRSRGATIDAIGWNPISCQAGPCPAS